MTVLGAAGGGTEMGDAALEPVVGVEKVSIEVSRDDEREAIVAVVGEAEDAPT